MKAWIATAVLGLAAFLAVALPCRERLDYPRLGTRSHLAGPAPLEIRRTSIPWCSREAPEPGTAISWRGNQRLLERALPPEPPFPSAFRIVHACDFPFPGREELLTRFVDEMAVVRPMAVLATGDIAYDTSEEWLTFVEGQFARLEALGIRVLAVPGNHERKGWAPWLRHFGPVLNHRADVGPVTVISLDSAHGRDRLTPSQLRWFEAQLEAAKGRSILVQLHHPVFPIGEAKHGDAEGTGGHLQGYRRRFLDLCRQYDVAAVLSGHWHQDGAFDASGAFRDDTADFPGPKFLVTTSLGDSVRRVTRWPHTGYGYRILEFENGRMTRTTHGTDDSGRPRPVAGTPLGTHLPPHSASKEGGRP